MFKGRWDLWYAEKVGGQAKKNWYVAESLKLGAEHVGSLRNSPLHFSFKHTSCWGTNSYKEESENLWRWPESYEVCSRDSWQVIVEDFNRFHQLTNGLCSCIDYWWPIVLQYFGNSVS